MSIRGGIQESSAFWEEGRYRAGGRGVWNTSSILGSGSAKARFAGTVRRNPQVMVKVSGRKFSAGQLGAHLDYIARDGDVELEDQDGNILDEKRDRNKLARGWDKFKGQGERTNSVAMVFSMPKGTKAQAVREAVRATANLHFGESHEYVMALHTDTPHPHVHLTVAARGHDGSVFNPHRDDLHALRQTFAQELRRRGVKAEASSCDFRMQEKRRLPQSVVKIIDRYLADKSKNAPPKKLLNLNDWARSKAAANDLETGFGKRQRRIWKQVLRHYDNAIDELAASRNPEDQALAEAAREYVREARERLAQPSNGEHIIARHRDALDEQMRAKGEQPPPAPENAPWRQQGASGRPNAPNQQQERAPDRPAEDPGAPKL